MTSTADQHHGLRIGEVAERVGVNPKTIRYYERIELIPEPARLPSGYRTYDSADVERLAFVRRAQRFGLTLAEIREVLAFRQDGQPPCDFVLDAVRRHADEVDQRIAELTELREELDALMARAGETAPSQQTSYCHLLNPADG